MTEHAMLTITEVIAMLRISRATYYRYVRRGLLNPRKLFPERPAHVLIPRSQVDELLSSTRQ